MKVGARVHSMGGQMCVVELLNKVGDNDYLVVSSPTAFSITLISSCGGISNACEILKRVSKFGLRKPRSILL